MFLKKNVHNTPCCEQKNHKDGITEQSVTVTMVLKDMKSHRQVVYDVAMEWSFQYVSPELISGQ